MDNPSRFVMFACQIEKNIDSDESLKMLMAYLRIFGNASNILPCKHIIFLIYQTTEGLHMRRSGTLHLNLAYTLYLWSNTNQWLFLITVWLMP